MTTTSPSEPPAPSGPDVPTGTLDPATGAATPADAAPAPLDPGTPDPEKVGRAERMRWFGTLWAMAMAYHYTDSDPLDVLLVLVAVLPLLVWPTSLLAFGLVVATSVVIGISNLPAPANHTVLSLMVALAFGLAAVWAYRTRGREAGTFGERWFDAARTPATLTLLVVYSFTVFHKLNTAFFDPINSCAGSLLEQGAGLFGIKLTLAPTVVLGAAVGTMIVETSILVLLANPRTCKWGLFLGTGFHMVLAPASFYDFATMVFALYVLFVPPRVLATLAPKWENLRMYALIGFGMHMLIAIVSNLVGLGGLNWHPMRVATWYLCVIPVMAALVFACLADRRTGERWPAWRWTPVVLLVVPLIAFVNGAAPYLGLKTTASYSMFSNLHTEGGSTNHLISGLSDLQVVDYEKDLVTITGITVPDPSMLNVRWARWAKEQPPVTVPMLGLRRVVLLWKDAGVHGVRVEYTHAGQKEVTTDAITDPVLAAPMPWWQTAFLAYRASDSGSGKDICRW
jgi:hypothetical protein